MSETGKVSISRLPYRMLTWFDILTFVNRG